MEDELTVQPADLVETIHSSLRGSLDIRRHLLGRPDITDTPSGRSNARARTWALTTLRLTWVHHAGGPGSVVTRGPWVLESVQLIAWLRLKSGGTSDKVSQTWDINHRYTFKHPLYTTMGYDDIPVPEYVVPLLDSMLPFDWDTERDGVPEWRK